MHPRGVLRPHEVVLNLLVVEREGLKGDWVPGYQTVQAHLFVRGHVRDERLEILLGNRDVDEDVYDAVVGEDRRIVRVTWDPREIVSTLVVEPPVTSHALPYLSARYGMSDAQDEVEEAGTLELGEGDVSVVIRADGEVEFLIFTEDEESDEYAHSMRMVEYLRFVLDNRECLDMFEKNLQKTFN